MTKTLLFMGEAGALSGDPGGKMFRAYDKATGEVVAEIELPSKTTGAPMTYMLDGKQYIVVAVSTREHQAEMSRSHCQARRSRRPRRRVMWLLHRRRCKGRSPDPKRVTAGRPIFASHCAICHGRGGEGVAGGPPALTSLRNDCGDRGDV